MRRSRAPKAYRIGLESLLLRHRLGHPSGMAIAMPPRRVNLNALETRLRAIFFHISRSTTTSAGSGDVSIVSGRPPSRGERSRRGHWPLRRPSPREEEHRHPGSTRLCALARSCLARGDLAPISCRHRLRVARCVRHHRSSARAPEPSRKIGELGWRSDTAYKGAVWMRSPGLEPR